MDFGLSEDQQLLEETLRSFLGDKVPITRVRELRDEDCPNDRAIWRSLAELGVTGILVPEAQGGSELSLLDAAIVAESLGRAATPAPFLGSGVMVPIALAGLADEQAGKQVEGWLSGIAGGELVFGLALTELFSVREGAGITLEGEALRGKAMMAFDVPGADFVLLAIDADRLAVVRGDAPGLSSTRLATIDATRCHCELILDAVSPEAVFENAGEAIARMLDAGRIALAADTLGACEGRLRAGAQAVRPHDRILPGGQAYVRGDDRRARARAIAGLVRGAQLRRPARRGAADGMSCPGAPLGDRARDRQRRDPGARWHRLDGRAEPALLVQAHRRRPAHAGRPGASSRSRRGATGTRQGELIAEAGQASRLIS